MAADGGCERDVVHRMNEGYRAYGTLKSVLSNRELGIKAKKWIYKEIYENKRTNGVVRSRGMGDERSVQRRKVNVLEMKCLRSLVGVS